MNNLDGAHSLPKMHLEIKVAEKLLNMFIILYISGIDFGQFL